MSTATPESLAHGAVKSIFADGEESVRRRFWNAKPFPHIYIDDFLARDRFDRLVETIREINLKPDAVFATSLEKNKTTFSSDALSEECRNLVASLTDARFLEELSRLTAIPEITPLTAYKGHTYKFYHKMEEGGFLGSHVDHSAVVQDKVHFLNCIFYGPEHWESAWGGHTVLFDKWGYKEGSRVECRPNRLLIFLHTSQSFHGVTKIQGSRNHRFTVYMDYYAKLADLQNLNREARAQGSNFESKFWKHFTTFVPLSAKDFHRYIRGYVSYLIKKKY